MIHVDSVTAAVYQRLAGDPVLVSSAFTVTEGEPFNTDLNETPWVGIYPGTLNVDPRTLGGQQPWGARLELYVYVQEAAHRSGQEANRRLGRAQAAVLAALDADRTLGGTVLMLEGLDVLPFQRDLAEDRWLFTNEIVLKAALRA